ncbi:hypothetical protein F5B22DRAFT_563037 [Xylaria bambusicola]|uniref:uncharacterized protein n=1 Tax=Xylaria bambusicola TaxID=326684 RepID=UPI002008E856|nr:uncharacterized protein F5B22DRAFT_563037 [Xylaria bambusicola]KAI0503148.1 hypothetical protein F5B22DRAFT_563037 [Xylaria bambusicola]
MAKCTNAPPTVPSDSGVAGIGVLLSFIITAAIALVISASLVIHEARGRSSSQKPSVLRRKLLNAYSDQQILTGIGIQSVGLAKIQSMVPYHFFIIWILSLLSMAVHNASLLALVRDFRRDWVLRWLRQFLIFVNLVLSSLYGIFILRAVQRGINDSTFPIACVWEETDGSGQPSTENRPLSFIGTIVVLAGNVVVFVLATWYLHSRTQRFYNAIRIVGLLLMTAISIGAVVRVSLLADAFDGKHPVKLSDGGEKQWSFGQLLSVGMLLLPVVSIIEILRGEIKCAPPVADFGDKTSLLGETELQTNHRDRDSFQPNPFFGSQTNLFRK